MSQAGSFNNGSTPPPPGSVITLTGNSGGAVGPDGSGNIDVVGSGAMDVTGNPGINTLTVTVATASTAQQGVVELATNLETITGTDATRAVTPASLSAKLGTQTTHAVAIGDGSTNAITWSNVGTDGQVLIGATGGDPEFATLTSTGGTILFTPGPNSLNLEASGGSGSGITVNADTGSASPIANVLTLKGAVGGNIETVGLANNLTVAVSGTTNHAVQVGNASGSLTSVGPGTTNTVLLGNTGFNPSFGLVPNAALVNKSISFANGNSISCSPTGPVDLGSGVTISVSGTSPHAVQVGAVTGGLSNIAVGTTNTVLVGNTGADPSFGKVPNGALVNSSITVNGDQNISVSGSPVALGGTLNLSFPDVDQYKLITANGSGAVESLPAGTGTSGQVLTSNGAGAYPTWQSSSAGSSIIVTEFTSSGTWTKNASTKMVEVLIIGGGGGGGSGACGNSGSASGGGGGGVVGVMQATIQASAFGVSETVTIGAGGTGGLSATSSVPLGGNAGTAGGVSKVGYLAPQATGSSSGAGGSGGSLTGNASGGGGGQGTGMIYNAFIQTTANSNMGGGQSGLTTGYSAYTPPTAGQYGFMFVLGGGGGAGANNAVAYRGGSIVANSTGGFLGTPAIGGVETGSIDGDNGAGLQVGGGFTSWGTGGAGGGGQKSGTRGGNGGNAGGYGSGGGGGGGSLLNSPSGQGGNGAPGYVRITEYL